MDTVLNQSYNAEKTEKKGIIFKTKNILSAECNLFILLIDPAL